MTTRSGPSRRAIRLRIDGCSPRQALVELHIFGQASIGVQNNRLGSQETNNKTATTGDMANPSEGDPMHIMQMIINCK
jgi:hypothetical protein